MTANEIVEAVLNGARIFASWPVLAFIMVWIFRKQIGDLLPALARRLGKVTIGGSIFEFGSEELRGTTVREDEVDESGEPLRSEIEELEQDAKGLETDNLEDL
ncbi:MAG: hypothetical protein IIC84_04500 [Chloroflexi bacterium]|nr:hypothetical protein [Chloroflexota bacterium]